MSRIPTVTGLYSRDLKGYTFSVDTMSERNTVVRQMRREFGPSYTLKEIGERFGLTRERVRQLTRGVSPGREVELALARALPVYAPIEVEIVNPWGVKGPCQRCLRPTSQETPWGPACASCQSSVRRHNSPAYKGRHARAVVRYCSGPCPRPTPRCLGWYGDVWQHIRGFAGHAEEYEEIYAELRRERGLPPRPAPPRRAWQAFAGPTRRLDE